MTRRDTTVAVIVTCYNEGRYVGAAVRSCLAQTQSDFIDKIVIADDGSDADTLAVLREIETWDPRIVVQYGNGGAGLPAQRNAAIAVTSSPYLAILDGDDFWHPSKLELQVPILSNDPGIGLVYSGYYTFGRDDPGTATSARVRDISGASDLTRTYFLNDPPIIPSTLLIRRSAFEACGGFDASIRIFEDTDFYLRVSRVCRFGFIKQPLLYKRSNGNSITGSRKDLMAHHASVALKAACVDHTLLPLVARRLAERARKLGNYRFLLGDLDEGRRLIRFALRLNPLNGRSWLSLLATASPLRPLWSMLGRALIARRNSMGATEPLR